MSSFPVFEDDYTLPPLRDPNLPVTPQLMLEYGGLQEAPAFGGFPAEDKQAKANELFRGVGAQMDNASFFENKARTYQANPQGETNGNGITAGSVLGGTVRGLASALEPLTLPQDVLFAVLGGQLDKEKTIMENLREIEWAKYVPGGQAPQRVVDGSDLLGYLGVEEGVGRRIGGVVLDLVADPLLAGAALTAVGKVSKLEKLTKLGQGIDKALSLRGVFDASKAIPLVGGSTLGEYYLKQSEKIISAYRNPTASILGIIESRFIKGAVDATLAKSTALKASLGDIGEQIFRNTGLAEAKGADVAEEAIESLAELNHRIFGAESKSWLKRAFSIVGEAGEAEKNLFAVPEIVRSSIMKEAYELVGRRGSLLDEGAKTDEVFDFTKGLVGEKTLIDATEDFDAVTERVVKLARDNGVNPELVRKNFREFVTGLTGIDSKLGYHMSGYEFVKSKFMEAFVAAGGPLEATSFAWQEVIRRGVKGDNILEIDFDELVTATKYRGQYRKDGLIGVGGEDAGKVKFTTAELPGSKTSKKLKEVLDGVETFSKLDINTYIQNLTKGHMRRAFGLFVDKKNFNGYIENVKKGKIIVSNVLDELNLADIIDGDLAKYIQDYQSALKSSSTAGKTGGRMGVAMTKHELARHLVEQQIRAGVDPKVAKQRARDSLLTLHGSASSGIDWRIKELQQLKYNYTKGAENTAGGGGSAVFGSQLETELDDKTLDLLGELSNPIISIYEQAAASKGAITSSEFLRSTYDLTREHGLTRSEAFTDATGVAYVKVTEGEGVLGAFSEKYVHPYLYDQLRRSLAQKTKNVPFQHLRNLITGSYLASPNVVTANFVGGLYTSALAGINPVRMIKALSETFLELHKNGGKDYEMLNKLKKHVGLSVGSLVNQDAMGDFSHLRFKEAGMGNDGIRGFIEDVGRFFDKQLKAPILGTKYAGWAGLSGFQFVENWFKVASFKTEYERLLKTTGNAAEAELKAAEIARTVVFDYSELPDLLKTGRDVGLLMFPGFPYFLAGRTLNAAINRPAVLAQADKISEGITNLFLDEEEKYAFYAAMSDWLRQDQGVPISIERNEAGDKVVRAIPLGQLIPTNGFDGSPYAESLSRFGLYGPLMEIIGALVTGEGSQASAKYGNVVFTPESTGLGRASEVMQFIYNSFAPAALRKLYSPSATGPDKGILPSISMPGNLAESMYSLNEIQTGKSDRSMKDAVLSILLRSPSRVALSGPLAQTEYNNARYQLDDVLSGLRKRYTQAVTSGNDKKASEILKQIQKNQDEFVKRWGEILQYQKQAK